MLTGKQRRYLRALAHGLQPIVQVGKGGVDAGLSAAVDRALVDHELVKVRLGENAAGDKLALAAALAAQTHSEVAQIIGRVVVLYRADPHEPVIDLP